MKKVLISVVMLSVCSAVVAEQTIQKREVDPLTVSRLERMVNVKKIVNTEVTDHDTVVYTFSQAGRTWTEEVPKVAVTGQQVVTRYSRLKLVMAIGNAGKFAALDAFLKNNMLPNGVPYWDVFYSAQYFTSDNELFLAGCALAIENGICSQEELAQILAASVD